MRAFLNLVEQTAADRVAEIIDAAGFDRYDREDGTEGYCATFALALYRILRSSGIDADLVFLCDRAVDGGPAYVRGHEGDIAQVYWRHVLVAVDGSYFDIDGRVELADALGNYCWERGGVPVITTISEAIAIIRSCRTAYDRRYRLKWRDQLGGRATGT